jgi:hypothetical protein
MTPPHRFVVNTNVGLQNFLKIKETKSEDVIISPRGKRHSVSVGSEGVASTSVDASKVITSSITIHPNLKSENFGGIKINYKDNFGSNSERKVAGIMEVKKGQNLFPIITSIGRNINRPNLTVDREEHPNDKFIELWPGTGIDPCKDSLAYSVLVCNRDVQFVFPEEFPRNTVSLRFKHFQIIFLYWLFNRPTRFRGTTLTFSTAPMKYTDGFEFHEVLNFTNDMTLAHSSVYDTLPDFPQG